MDHLIRMKRQTGYSISNWKIKSYNHYVVLVGDFNLPDVPWKYNTADRKQSRSSCSKIPGVIHAGEMEAQIRLYHSQQLPERRM